MKIIDISEIPQAIEPLAHWHFNEWHHLYPDNTLEDFKVDLRACTAPGIVPSTFVAVDRDTAIGSISLLTRDMELDEPWTPWLANLYVHPDFRQQGLGKQLIQHLLQFCAGHGVDRLYLFTPESRTYYEKLGWVLLRRQQYKGERIDIMVRDLSA